MEASDILRQAKQLHRRGNLETAGELYQKLLSSDPQDGHALHGLGLIALQLGLLDVAERMLSRAIQVVTDEGSLRRDLFLDLGCLHQARGDLDLAIQAFDSALRLDPRSAPAHHNRGYASYLQQDVKLAVQHLEQALSLDPTYLDAMVNLATVQREQGHLETALEWYDRALGRDPGCELAREGRSLAVLQLGHFETGWADYEFRRGGLDRHPIRHDLAMPRWQGERLRRGHLLVLAEQGIGDEIMFLSCLNEVLARVRRATVTCSPRLVPLLNRSFPKASFIGLEGADRLTWQPPASWRVDRWIMAGSLPGILRTRADCFPTAAEAYIKADPAEVAAWRQSWNGVPAVGISWRAGATAAQQAQRSLAVDELLPLLSRADLNIVSLQHGDCRPELATFEARHGIRIHRPEGLDPLRELDRFAAMVAALDAVVSVDNTNVHLAGALGVRTCAVLPPAPNWRWTRGSDTALWYPSVRLFRAQRAQGWTEPLQAVWDQLSQWLPARQAA